MKILRRVATGATLLSLGCADGRSIQDPAPAAQRHSSQVLASAARQVEASGNFDALVDFSTLTLTPRGRNCLLQVNGTLVFTGTITGTASGQTSALVFASCADAATNPPGTFADVFKFEGAFEGSVDGEPAEANLLYMGRVQPGGQIAGRLVFSNGVAGRLEVEAVVAVGGEYSGPVVVQ